MGGGYYKSVGFDPLIGVLLRTKSEYSFRCSINGPTLVTGGTGMIGGEIARLLLERGDVVRVMVRARGAASEALEELGAKIVIGDVTDVDSVFTAVDGCASIYHCAGLVNPFQWNIDDYDRVNVAGTGNVLDAALSTGTKQFLHVSSIAALGARPGSLADETTQVRDAWKRGYGRSKFASEELVRSVAGQMHAVIVNPAVVFGRNDRHFVRLINVFLKGRLPAIAFKNRPLPLVYLSDVARGSLLAMERGKTGKRYILAQPTVTVGEFFLELARSSGRRPPRINLPDWIVLTGAMAWSVVSALRRRPSPIEFLKHGAADYDGGMVTQELGLTYTPFREAIQAVLSDMK